MSLYRRITTFALESGLTDANEAWEAGKRKAVLDGDGTVSTHNKGCPKSAFISLAENGYITDFKTRSERQLSENALHALAGYEVQFAQPNIVNSKGAWWHETAKKRNSSRQGRNGVLDVLLAAMEIGRFQCRGEEK